MESEGLPSGAILVRRAWWSPLPADWWVAISPCIYHPRAIDPMKWPTVVAHEEVHIRQQDGYGLVRWLWRYGVSREFRFEQEVEAMRVEYWLSPTWQRHACADMNARALAKGYRGLDFKCAALSYEQAYREITRPM